MIINAMADANVKNDSVDFRFRPISYEVSTNAGVLKGEVDAESYKDLNVSSLGGGPYTVSLGYVNHSYQAKPVEVSNPDALVTFWMAFPTGTNYSNGPRTYIFDPES